jgi:hypothetical protein
MADDPLSWLFYFLRALAPVAVGFAMVGLAIYRVLQRIERLKDAPVERRRRRRGGLLDKFSFTSTALRRWTH